MQGIDLDDVFHQAWVNEQLRAFVASHAMTLAPDWDAAILEGAFAELKAQRVMKNKRPSCQLESSLTIGFYPKEKDAYRYDESQECVVCDGIKPITLDRPRIERGEKRGKFYVITADNRHLAVERDFSRKVWMTPSLASLAPRSGRSAMAGRATGYGPNRSTG